MGSELHIHNFDYTDSSSPTFKRCKCGVHEDDVQPDCPCCGHPHCGLHGDTVKLTPPSEEVRAAAQRTNPCPRCGSTLIHKDCGLAFAEIMKQIFPYWQSEDKDDYFYLVRKDDLLAAAQEIAILTERQRKEATIAAYNYAAKFIEDNCPYVEGIGSVGIAMAEYLRKRAVGGELP